MPAQVAGSMPAQVVAYTQDPVAVFILVRVAGFIPGLVVVCIPAPAEASIPALGVVYIQGQVEASIPVRRPAMDTKVLGVLASLVCLGASGQTKTVPCNEDAQRIGYYRHQIAVSQAP
jgi:hypothetical protein